MKAIQAVLVALVAAIILTSLHGDIESSQTEEK